MGKRVQWNVTVVALTGLIASGISVPSSAMESQDKAAEVASTTQSVLEQTEHSAPIQQLVETDNGAIAADGNFSVSGGDIDVSLGEGEVLSLGLPSEVEKELEYSPRGTMIASGDRGLNVEIQKIENGSARILSIAEAHFSESDTHDYEYPLTLPAGAWAEMNPDGSVAILRESNEAPFSVEESQEILEEKLPPLDTGEDYVEIDQGLGEADSNVLPTEKLDPVDPIMSESLIGIIAPAWSVDATGTALPTELKIEGNTLIQSVDTRNAVFPVVSDPLPLVGIALVGLARILAPFAVRAFAAVAIRRGAAYTIRGGYASFSAFKGAYGTRKGYQWHHIVEQSTIRSRGWDSRAIHHPNNLVQIPTEVHQKCVNSWMGKKGVTIAGVTAARGKTIRQTIQSRSFSSQHGFGVDLLRYCGVKI